MLTLDQCSLLEEEIDEQMNASISLAHKVKQSVINKKKMQPFNCKDQNKITFCSKQIEN